MEDYKSLWVSWVSNHPNYIPSYHLDCKSGQREKYLDVVTLLCANPKFTQEHAKMFYFSDMRRSKMLKIVQKKLDDELMKELHGFCNYHKRYFVTIGFNHQTWNVKDCVKAIHKILEMSWIHKAQANFELHRENGEHPHCHFFIETQECKSDVLYKLFRPKYIQKLVLNKSFIDIKEWQDYHKEYMDLNKVKEKMPYVAMDIEWRKKNGIQIYKKNGGTDGLIDAD